MGSCFSSSVGTVLAPTASSKKISLIGFFSFFFLTLSPHKAFPRWLRLHPYGVIKRRLMNTLSSFLALKSNQHLAVPFYTPVCNLAFLNFDTFCLLGLFSTTYILKKMTGC